MTNKQFTHIITLIVAATVAHPSLSLAQSPPTPAESKQNVQLVYSLRGHIWNVAALALSPDGQILVSGSFDQTIKVWNLNTRKLLTTLDGHVDGVNAVVVSPDGQIFVSAGGTAQANTDKTIKIWNLKTRRLITTLTGHSQGITSSTLR